jgi:hypothetical protein
MNDLQNNLAREKTAVFGDMSAFSAHPSDFPSAARPQPKGVRRCTLIIADETSVHCIHWRDFRASQRASNKRNRCGVENSNANLFVCGLSVPHQALLAGLPRISGAPFIHNHHLTLNHLQSPASEPLGGSSSEAGGKIPAVHENVRRTYISKPMV